MKRKKSVRKEPNDLQNIFTAYLSKVAYRRRGEYIYHFTRRQNFEMQTDEELLDDLCEMEEDWARGLPLWMQIKSEALLPALKTLNPREQAVPLARVLEDKPSQQIAEQLGTQAVRGRQPSITGHS